MHSIKGDRGPGRRGLPRATEGDPGLGPGSRDSRPSARSCHPPVGVSAAAAVKHTLLSHPLPGQRDPPDRGTELPSGAHLLAVRQVDAPKQRVVFRPRLPRVVLVQEDRRAAHLQADLLDALLVVDGDQEGLAALLGFHSAENGEVLGKCGRWNRGQRSEGSREGPDRAPHCSLQTGRLGGLATLQPRAARSKPSKQFKGKGIKRLQSKSEREREKQRKERGKGRRRSLVVPTGPQHRPETPSPLEAGSERLVMGAQAWSLGPPSAPLVSDREPRPRSPSIPGVKSAICNSADSLGANRCSQASQNRSAHIDTLLGWPGGGGEAPRGGGVDTLSGDGAGPAAAPSRPVLLHRAVGLARGPGEGESSVRAAPALEQQQGRPAGSRRPGPGGGRAGSVPLLGNCPWVPSAGGIIMQPGRSASGGWSRMQSCRRGDLQGPPAKGTLRLLRGGGENRLLQPLWELG